MTKYLKEINSKFQQCKSISRNQIILNNLEINM